MDVKIVVSSTGDPGGVLQSLGTWAGILEAVATAIALVIAGVWSYLLFVRQRQRFPRAEISHRTLCVDLTESALLVHVTVIVKNVGTVLIRLLTGHVQIHRLRPLTTKMMDELILPGGDPVPEGCSEIEWPLLGRRDCTWEQDPREIEPYESDEFHFDFVIDSTLQTLEVYSYFGNVLKRGREIGWNHTTVAELSRCRVDVDQQNEERGMPKDSGGGKKVPKAGQGPPKSRPQIWS